MKEETAFKYHYQAITNLSLFHFVELVNTANSKAIKDLKIIDLFLERTTFVGIYVFYNELNIPLYIGKTAGRGFLERIGGHFDLRNDAYMNHYVAKLAMRKYGMTKKNQLSNAMIEDMFWECQDHRLAFFSFHNASQIQFLEQILQSNISGLLNASRRKGLVDMATLILDYENLPPKPKRVRRQVK